MEMLAEEMLQKLSDISNSIDVLAVFNGDNDCLQTDYYAFAKEATKIRHLMKEFRDERDQTVELHKRLKELETEVQEINTELAELKIPDFFERQKMLLIESENIQSKKENTKPKELLRKQGSSTKRSQKKAPPILPSLSYITAAEYSRVPGYMKGRILYSEVNKAIDTLNLAAVQKYKIVNASRSYKMPDYNRRKKIQYEEQEGKDTIGCHFVTDEDIKEFSGAKLDKHFQSILTILRHCGRLKLIRGGGVIRHVLQQS